MTDKTTHPEGRAYFDALKANGRKMSTANAKVCIIGETHISVHCSYNAKAVNLLRGANGRWDATRKAWVYPITAARALHLIIDAVELIMASLVEGAEYQARLWADTAAAYGREHEAREAARIAETAAAMTAKVQTDAALHEPGATRRGRLNTARLSLDEADAARRAELLATADVRRVLNLTDIDGTLCEAWMPRKGHHQDCADCVRFTVPGGPYHKVDWRCPSFREIRTRSPVWGCSVLGGTFLLVSDADWEVLVVETAAMTLKPCNQD